MDGDTSDSVQIPDVERDDAMEWPEHRDIAQHWISLFQAQGILVDSGVIKDFSRVTRLPFFKHAGTGQAARAIFLNRQAGWNRFVDIKDVPSQDCLHQIENNGTCGAQSVQRAKNCKGGAGSTIVTPFTAYAKEHIEKYKDLLTSGISARHTRLECHRYIMTAATVYGWGEDRLEEVGRRIFGMNPQNIGCSPKAAVADLIRHRRRMRSAKRFFLPNLSKLPVPSNNHCNHLLDELAKAGCPEPAKAARIILKVVVPAMRSCPVQAENGKLNLHTRKIQRAVRKCMNSRYTHIMEWFDTHGLIECTNRSYVVGVQTRTYRVNIPLLLLLLGYRTEELDWAFAEPWGDVLAVA